MFGIKSTQEQLADFRDESDTGVAFVHIDTCLSCYLQDHHNRDGECLFGVHVDGNSTVGDVYSGLIDEVRSTGDRIDESVSDYAIDKAILALFEGTNHSALFDKSLEVPEEDADDIGESCQAWFVLTWDVNPYVAWDIYAGDELVHNCIVTQDERLMHLSDYMGGSHVWERTGSYSADEAEDMTFTDRGLAHLDDEKEVTPN